MKNNYKYIFYKKIYDLVLTFEYGSILINDWLNDEVCISRYTNINDDHFIIFNVSVKEAYDEEEQHFIVKANELLPLIRIGDI